MTTESDFTRFSGSLSRFKFDDETLLPFPDQYVDASSTMDNSLLTPDTEPCNSAQCSVEGDFLADDNEFSESVFKYISQMLMEEDMEEQQILPDPLALQAAEKSLHQVLDGNLPSSSNHYPSYTNSPDDSYYYSGNSGDYGALSSSDYSGSFGGNGNSFGDFAENGGSASPPIPQHLGFQSSTTDPPLFQPSSGVFFSASHASKMVDSLMDQTKFSNSTTQSELMSQFQKGVEEANKFLPNLGNQWFTNLDKVSTYNLPPKEFSQQVKVEEDNETHHDFSNGFREKKNHEREDAEIEGRSSKQSVIDLEEIELSDMFDKMFIFPDHEKGGRGGHCKGPRKGPPRDAEAIEDPTPKPRPKKPLNTNHANKEVVDLRMLLILAAQAVNADDRRTAHEYVKQIRQHSSPLGDGSQRMAHYFANGLEARLDGNGSQIYNALASKRISPIDVLKAYQIYLSVCPFQKLANIFSNNKILILAEDTKSLHIIDFGILYGFQWPALIFRLSKRPGGPPRLRITGIELPDRGFRPAERVLQTGRHLAKCCVRFNVPFEYNGIAQKWETITTKDLNLREEDMVVVNCMFRFKNLLDQTVVLDNPRDSVLNLVKNINPNLFTLSVVNGSYGVPFFVTRFREALFHYSSLFDSLDANLPVDDPMRMMFEKEWYGREIMNVIACEGSERVERPETYKRWQIRNVRVGFKQVSLDPMIMKKLRFKLKGGGYNDEFVIDEDGEWMLQGWKGRIVYASSYWVTDGKG